MLRTLIHKVAKTTIWHDKTGLTILPLSHLERLGSKYGGWIVPIKLLPENFVCYCAGAGEDITFDLELMRRFKCEIFSYDPTPKAILYVKNETSNMERYHFFPIGLWERDGVAKFYAPKDAAHVSHSIVNLQRTRSFFEAPCSRLSTLMKQNGHLRIDLLKLDIEGAEYKVLETILEDGIVVDIICVEFDEMHHSLDADSSKRIHDICHGLVQGGWIAVAMGGNSNFTFIHKRRLNLFHKLLFQFFSLLQPARS